MISRIRQLMAAPFARPPGRRKFLVRWDPELRAAVLYAVFFLVAWLFRDESHPFMIGALPAYLLLGLVLFMTPTAQAAGALAAERDSGTAEALVLTPGDHSRLAWGRFLHAAWPWMRLLLWMLPLYIAMIPIYLRFSWSPKSVFLALGPKVSSLSIVYGHGYGSATRTPVALVSLLVIGRFIKDAIDVLTLVAVGFHMAARMRSGRHATALAGALGPMLLVTVFMADVWMWTLARPLARLLETTPDFTGGFYPPAALGMLVFQTLAIWWCVSRVARNFDYYMLGEQPER